MPPVSIVSVWHAAEDRQRDRRPERHPQPVGADDPGLGDLEPDDEDDEEADQRDERAVAEQPAHAVERAPAAARGDRRAAHRRRAVIGGSSAT